MINKFYNNYFNEQILLIDPVLLKLGPLEIRWYSIAYILGMILGLKYIRFLQTRNNIMVIKSELEDQLILFLILAIVIGARIFHIFIYNLDFYLANPMEMIKTWKGGLSFHGGVVGVIIAIGIFSAKYKINFWALGDLIGAATPIGIFFGRIANFINGELYGRITEVSWGIKFLPYENFKRHPSQIYEALTEGLLNFIIIYICFNKYKFYEKRGKISGTFLILYSIFRICIENFRQMDESIGFVLPYITMGQILSLPMLVTGMIIYKMSQRGDFGYNKRLSN